MTNNPLTKLSDPKYITMYKTFNKISDRANDPTFKALWISKRGQVLRMADQQLLEETQDA